MPGEMLQLFLKSGGFGVFVDGRRGARSFVTAATNACGDLSYVYRIVLALCRFDKYVDDARKRSLKYAINFVQKDDDTYTVRKITDIWETKKRAAPYIFAFYSVITKTFPPAESATSVGTRQTFTEVVRALVEVASDQRRLTELAGTAAYAADILNKRAKHVRTRDFTSIKPLKPPISQFSNEEQQLLQAVEPDRLTEKELGIRT